MSSTKTMWLSPKTSKRQEPQCQWTKEFSRLQSKYETEYTSLNRYKENKQQI